MPRTLPLRPAAPNFDGKSWWDYVKVLAADDMEGRETGSEGLRKAAAYIVEQLKADGLEPAGVSGFYQPVKLVSRQIDESASSLALVRDGKDEPLALGQDAMFSTRVDLAPEVDAPLVFVGYGLRVPEKDYDDFAGLDLKGKVAVHDFRLSFGDAVGAGIALSVRSGAFQGVARGRRDRHYLHPESGFDGHSLEPHDAGAYASQHGAG